MLKFKNSVLCRREEKVNYRHSYQEHSMVCVGTCLSYALLVTELYIFLVVISAHQNLLRNVLWIMFILQFTLALKIIIRYDSFYTWSSQHELIFSARICIVL